MQEFQTLHLNVHSLQEENQVFSRALSASGALFSDSNAEEPQNLRNGILACAPDLQRVFLIPHSLMKATIEE